MKVVDATDDVQTRAVAVIAEVLDRPLSQVVAHASLIDDLGAESIDFLDIVFQLETAFGLKIPSEEIWKGSLQTDDPGALAEGLAGLRQRMPEFDWDRFPADPRPEDLPRLITVQTVVDYLRRRLEAAGAG